jgi:hypothetical protein
MKNGQVELDGVIIPYCEEGGEKYIPTVHRVGYIGEGKYKVSIHGKHTPEYDRWKGILRRCYSEKERFKNLTYIDCIVDEQWLNFQNFAQWWHENYYEIEGQQMQVDKDILHKGNKVYSPETCVFVPQDINILFTKRHRTLPTGVQYDKKRNKYRAFCGINNKLIAIGNNFETIEDAFYLGYKPFKEQYIKNMADEYKDRIPIKLYNAMYNYQVEIDD